MGKFDKYSRIVGNNIHEMGKFGAIYTTLSVKQGIDMDIVSA